MSKKVPAAKTAETHPWLLEKPYVKPRFFRGWKDAQAAVRFELEDLRDEFQRLRVQDAQDLIAGLLKEVSRWAPEQDNTVAGVVDPVTQVKYRASIRKRAQL